MSDICDTACLLSYERIHEITAPYCVRVYIIDISGKLQDGGFYMSELAVSDMKRFICLN